MAHPTTHTTGPDLTAAEQAAFDAAGESLGAARPADAVRTLRGIGAERSGSPKMLRLWTRALAEIGRHEEALVVLRRLIGIAPGDAYAADMIARYERAFEDPEAQTGPARLENFHTSIPTGFLNQIQRSLHRYTYAGVPMLKNPFDLAIYSKLIFDLRPEVILEVGSKTGASGLWLAHQCDAFGLNTRIISIDIIGVTDVRHDRVSFREGDARDLGSVVDQSEITDRAGAALVIEDADHAYPTCAAVGRFLDGLLRPGDYLVYEDGIISDLSPEAYPDASSGPHTAVKELLAASPCKYELDTALCDTFGTNVTWASNGFLKRTAV